MCSELAMSPGTPIWMNHTTFAGPNYNGYFVKLNQINKGIIRFKKGKISLRKLSTS